MKSSPEPIFIAHLFNQIEYMLIGLLRSLKTEDWEKPTIAGKWNVKDVTAHLLDTQLRKLSIVRDGFVAEIPVIKSNADLIAFINRLNHEGVMMYRRLSPELLIRIIEISSKEFAEFHQSLDPFAKAAFAVSWAGEETSQNWFDTAREYTERWLHQQHIRLAVNKPGIMTKELYYPVLDTFMRALPYHYRNIKAEDGKMIQLNITGNCGGSWYLYRDKNKWHLIKNPSGEKITDISIPGEITWRIFTKGIDRQSAENIIGINGDKKIGLHILNMLTIVG
ncbi:MAG: maleylpyruvate isomerase N-terminal domain-containing protein [Bacteroidetes bacterium]|nr:maleylpyruvate isomerase N-terminal domain-containing protein [Bacteroidota bacterium]